METPEQICERLRALVPGVSVDLVANPAPSAQHSLRVGRDGLLGVAGLLRDDPALRLDYCSNVTGVDWMPRQEKVKLKRVVDGVETEVEEVREIGGFLEVVYHLYSMALRHGPVVLRVRTGDRTGDCHVPSLTSIWRSCELQEREVYDLFGVIFEGHPDLRRLLMWDGFVDHPMRKDYVDPDDYEYEPTPHDQVLERARVARASRTGGGA